MRCGIEFGKPSIHSTTPRPSNVTGGLLFDLGFNHLRYLLLSADLPCFGSDHLKLPWISVSHNALALGFRLQRTFTSEVFRLVHFTSLNRLGIRGKLELQVSPTAAARHEKNETRDGIYLHPMSFRTLLPSCKLPSGFTSRASGSARSVRSAHWLPCLS